jgi:hypothetical protein
VLGDSGVPRKSSSYGKLTTGLSWPAQPGNVRQAYLFPTKESAISTPLKNLKKGMGKNNLFKQAAKHTSGGPSGSGP